MAETEKTTGQKAPEQDVLSAGTEKQLEEENKKKILAFNVAHILVSLLFLWLLYEASNLCRWVMLTSSVPFRRSGFSFSPKGFY
jgi:hypothetical protein